MSESLYEAELSREYVLPATVALVGLAVEGKAAVYVPVTLFAYNQTVLRAEL
ncbi:hypothetical protein SDC9_76710 [bioreactor metagenome]|uniref:Uncharacterized protein n=1 Tax=bioreactor metagenome TaxID=1076179 RepID=A0A644YNJ5_9ZZZZ